jgi:hypothetical protein
MPNQEAIHGNKAGRSKEGCFSRFLLLEDQAASTPMRGPMLRTLFLTTPYTSGQSMAENNVISIFENKFVYFWSTLLIYLPNVYVFDSTFYLQTHYT